MFYSSFFSSSYKSTGPRCQYLVLSVDSFLYSWSDKCGLGNLEATTHNRHAGIPQASLLFQVVASGGCFGLSETYYKIIFFDSTKCKVVSAFSVWKRYWSTNLYVFSSRISVSTLIAPDSYNPNWKYTLSLATGPYTMS